MIETLLLYVLVCRITIVLTTLNVKLLTQHHVQWSHVRVISRLASRVSIDCNYQL